MLRKKSGIKITDHFNIKGRGKGVDWGEMTDKIKSETCSDSCFVEGRKWILSVYVHSYTHIPQARICAHTQI